MLWEGSASTVFPIPCFPRLFKPGIPGLFLWEGGFSAMVSLKPLPKAVARARVILSRDTLSGESMLFANQLRELLGSARRIAIIGAKDNIGAPVDRVGRYLINAGFDVMPIHVVRDTTWGLPTAHNITELPDWGFEPDIVCLFRNPMYCEGHAREVLQLPKLPKVFWMQEGIRSPEAGKLMAEAGVKVVEDLCLKTVHQDLFKDKTETFSCERCWLLIRKSSER